MTPPWLALLLTVTAAAAGEWLALRALLSGRPWWPPARNYRGAEVVHRGGVTFAGALVAGLAVAAAAQRSLGFRADQLLTAVVTVTVFGLLGWLDDARGAPGARGLLGHLRRLLLQGELTTGLVKAVGGTLVGLWAAYRLDAPGWAVVPAGAVIALSANTLNALDVRPGRAGKLFVPLAVLLLVVAGRSPLPAPLVLPAALLGAVLVFLPADLRERVMLGDTGANPLGVALGLAVVSVTRWPTWIGMALLLLLGCLLLDRWSLTAAIERNRALRWLDGLGRP